MTENNLRQLPSMDSLLRRVRVQDLVTVAGHLRVRDVLREVLAELRAELRKSEAQETVSSLRSDMAQEIERRLNLRLHQQQRADTQRVINATGVVLHTNLGRAPLGKDALEAINRVAAGYCNLEYDLASGQRGKRGTGLTATLCDLLHCEDAVVVNNCAAAVLITLNSLAEGGEVIVSRGELIEIGGSFRIPDVIAKSGARMREVGTTNRTRLADYEQAINENTRVILRAHPSNFRIVGFTEKPELAELAALAHRHQLLLFEDLGSGCLLDLTSLGITDEPTVMQSLAAGVHLVSFSGDKLLGGPQAGIILGKAELTGRIRKNPLMRALRADKLTYAALEATINAYVRGTAITDLPVPVALQTSLETLTRRARRFLRRVRAVSDRLVWQLLPGDSVIGGGTTPAATLPTMLVALTSTQANADQLAECLRHNSPPVITRIMAEQVTFDLRTVSVNEESEILSAVRSLEQWLSQPGASANSAP